MSDPRTRPSAEALLREIGEAPRLTVYLASAPGAGKTRRLIEDALSLQRAGRHVAIGWLETKGRPDLDVLAAPLPRLPPRTAHVGPANFNDFDFEAALAVRPEVLVLDELAHTNLEGGTHVKRWQDALALRSQGISVVGALNIQHVETVAAVAEGIIGFPVREIVPLSFLKAADHVIALDVSPEQIESRLRAGGIVHADDVERALAGPFRRANLRLLRELMLNTIDDLTIPTLSPAKTSTALAIVTGEGDAAAFVRKVAALASNLDLALVVTAMPSVPRDEVEQIAVASDAETIDLPSFDWGKPRLVDVKATLVAVPLGALAAKIAAGPAERDTFIAGPVPFEPSSPGNHPPAFGSMTQAAGDLLRIGYGRLTIYFGAAAGTGKTYAMLDRAHQLKNAGVDVVAAYVETHGRAETERLLEGLEVLPRAPGDGGRGELDVDAVLARRPTIALVDELAHTNAPGSAHAKRFDDVLTLLRSGISVMTTLNVQHLEGLNDAVYRLTGQRVRETLPDAILEMADDVIVIDTTPQTLRERLRAGKIYPADRIERALSNFFRTENLAALRELAVREVVRARSSAKHPPPFSHLVLGVKARERDIALIERCARLALRLQVDLDVVHASRRPLNDARVVSALAEAAHRVRAGWRVVLGDNPVHALIEAAGAEHPTIAVEGARGAPRWGRFAFPFARRLLDAGARQIVILAPEST